MTDQEINIAVAEALGWHEEAEPIGSFNATAWWHNNDRYPSGIVPFPDYANDLNAMHEAEKVFIGDASSAMTFAMHLLRINGQRISTEHEDLNCDHAWITAHATAAQRAEAFLRTIGKWFEQEITTA